MGPYLWQGKSKACLNPACRNYQKQWYAARVWLYSLHGSTYGLDVLAWIGWQHEHEHRQLVEIQRELNQRGIEINERNVGKLYRQFLALLGAVREPILQKLDEGMAEHGGLIFGVDALQPEGSCNLLYVLYEVLSESVVPAIQLLPLFLSPAGEQNCAGELLEIENQFRVAIRDAVNRPSRKPFYWGGLQGYRQLAAIGQVLHTMPVA